MASGLVLVLLVSVAPNPRAQTGDGEPPSPPLVRLARALAGPLETDAQLISAAAAYAEVVEQPAAIMDDPGSMPRPDGWQPLDETMASVLARLRRLSNPDQRARYAMADLARRLAGRGPVNGPRRVTRTVAAGADHVVDVAFKGNERATIAVYPRGAGAGDLDLIVERRPAPPAARAVVQADLNSSGYCHVTWVTPRAELLYIVVRNRGTQRTTFDLYIR